MNSDIKVLEETLNNLDSLDFNSFNFFQSLFSKLTVSSTKIVAYEILKFKHPVTKIEIKTVLNQAIRTIKLSAFT